MIKEAFATEETVALAKRKACEFLGVDQDKVTFEVIQMPERKKFGLFGGKLAQVRAFIKETPADKAINYIKEILYYMGLESLEVEQTSFDENVCVITLKGRDLKYIVGKHGETLDALQYLSGLVANNSTERGSYCKIRLEAGEYRDKRRKSLEAYGRRKAYEAIKNGDRIDLEPMRSYERKIVHMAVKSVEGMDSWSEGQDENRHVVIAPILREKDSLIDISLDDTENKYILE